MRKTIDTLFVGKTLHEFDTLPSTNQYAIDLLASEKPSEGTVILTHNQYAGRGQLTNKWESEPGKNLTFSLILYPTFLQARNQFLLNQVVSLSVFATLKQYLAKGLTIKWPNDIYVFDKKITGILIQNSLKGVRLQSAIIGIGLNVNQRKFLSDAPNPTSLALELDKEVDLSSVLSVFCQHLERYYLQLKSNNILEIQQDYTNNLFRLGTLHDFKKVDGTPFKGIIEGVSSIGKLNVKTDEGSVSFAFKEISYIL